MKTFDRYKKNEIFLAAIASSFFLLYGLTPYILNEMGLFVIDEATENLVFSLIAACFPLILVFLFSNAGKQLSTGSINLHGKFIFLVFLVSVCVFYAFPWHDDRESAGASVAAVFRGLWLVLMVSCYGEPRAKTLRLILMTLILMVVDQSRTAFGLALFVLGLSFSVKSLSVLILLMSASAAWRMGESDGFLNDVMYGLVGEGYNGAKGALQAISVKDFEIDYFSHIFQLIFQPIITVFQIALTKFDFGDLDSTRHIGELTEKYLGQVYSPMGGFYIAAEFAYYGLIGLFLLFIYLFITYWLTKRLFDTDKFPAGSLLFIISIKATPYVYWKYVIYLYLIKLLLIALSRFSRRFRFIAF